MKYVLWMALAAAPLAADVNSTVYLPHIAEGGTWKTVFTIVNLGTLQTGSGILHVWGNDGQPLAVLPGPGGTKVSQLTVTVPPSGMTTVETAGDASIGTVTGWADFDVQTAAPTNMIISALMRQSIPGRQDYEAFIPSRRIATKSQIFLFDHRYKPAGSDQSGFGMMNASRVNIATVGVTIRDENGQVLNTSTLSLAPGEHTSFSLFDRYYAATNGKRGTVEFAPQPGGWFAIIGLRFSATGPFNALDVMEP